MVKRRKPLHAIAIIGLVCVLVSPIITYRVQAETSIEHSRKLLEQSLTIHEIDIEVERLNVQEVQLQEQMIQTEKQIIVQEKVVTEAREQAGKILKAHYMGERNSIIDLIFASKSIQEAVTAIEFIRAIMASDQRKLVRHQQAYEQLVSIMTQFKQTEQELADVKQAFINQRERLVRLQQDLDVELALQEEEVANQLREQMKQLTEQWDREGKPLFEKYLSNFANSSQQLPDYILDHPDLLQQEKGSTVRFQISDEQFNNFLHTTNPLLANMTISFEEDLMIVSGGENDLSVSISGFYALEQEPENVVQFHVNELIFNAYTLPDTTAKNMSSQFDLGFNPGLMMTGLEATKVKISKGMLQIWFDFDLSQLFG